MRETGEPYNVHEVVAELEREMLEAAEALEYERAGILRDQIRELKASSQAMGDGQTAASSQKTRAPVRYKVSKKRRNGRKAK